MDNEPAQRRTEEMDTTMQQSGAVPPRDDVRRLIRRREGKVIAGVAAGVADYFRIDPVLVRIGFVAAALAGGTGLIAYLAGWLLIPEAEEPGAPARAHGGLDRPQAWVGIALLVVGASMLFGRIGWWDSGVLWALALIGIGLALFLRDRESPAPAAGAPSPPPGGGAAGGTPPAHPSSSAPAQRRERSALGLLTIAAALVAVGSAGLLSNLGAFKLSGYQLASIGLATVGAGLLVGAWWGGSRGLIALGLVLLPVALASSAVRVPLEGGFGERLYAPRSATALRNTYRLGAGRMVLDLTRYPFEREPVAVAATVGAGEIEVLVPPGVGVSAHAGADLGQVTVFGTNDEGSDVELTRVTGGPEQLALELRASVGDVIVRRTTVPAPGSGVGESA